VRCDKVARGEAGVTAYVGVLGARGDTESLGIGMHLYPAKQGRRQRNHVTTLMPPISAKGLEARLKRQRHCRREVARWSTLCREVTDPDTLSGHWRGGDSPFDHVPAEQRTRYICGAA
jgi:hypothetical protein